MQFSRSFIMKSIPLMSPGILISFASFYDLNMKSALFSFFFLGGSAGFSAATSWSSFGCSLRSTFTEYLFSFRGYAPSVITHLSN